MKTEVLKTISGGQTGVDRAALDAALAPGFPHGVWWLEHGEKVQTGSNFSAPMVAGWIARLISCRPDLDVLEVKAALRDIARRSADPTAGNPNETLHE